MADNEQLQVTFKTIVDDKEVVQAAKTIGEYKLAIQQAKDEMDKLDTTSETFNKDQKSLNDTIKQASSQLSDHTKGLNSFGGVIKELGSKWFPNLTKATGGFSLALDTIGIGEILLLITGFIEGLKAIGNFFLSDAKVAEEFGAIMAGLGNVVTALAEEFTHLGDTILHPIDAVKKLFHAFESGKKAKEAQDELVVSTAKMNKTITEQSTELEKLKTAAKDQTKSIQERQKAAQDALKIEDQITAEKVANAKKELDAFNESIKGRTDLSKVELAKQIDLEAKVTQQVNDGIASRRKLETENNTFEAEQKKKKDEQVAKDNKKAEESFKKHQEDLQKITKEYLKNDIDNIIDKAKEDIKLLNKNDKNYDKLVKAINDKRDKEIDKINKKKLKDEKDTQDKIVKLNEQASLDTDQIQLGKAKSVEEATKSEIKVTKYKYDEEIKQAGNNKEKIAQIEKEKAAALKVILEKEKENISDVEQKSIDESQGASDAKIADIQATADKEIEAANGNADLIKAIQDKANADKVKAAQDAEDKIVKIKSDGAAQISAITDTEVKNDADANKAEEEAKKKSVEARKILESSLMNVLNDLDSLFTNLTSSRDKKSLAQKNKDAKTEFNLKKASGVVGAAISTAEGIAAHTKDEFPLNVINIAAAAATGAASIATILSKKFTPESPSSGSSVPSSSGSSSPTSIPSGNQFQASSFFNLGQNNPNAPAAQPQQVYVTEHDISSTQNKVSVIQGRGTLG